MDPVEQLIVRGKAATEQLWSAPDDPVIRTEVRGVLAELRRQVEAAGTPEMCELCDDFSPSANTAPTPQAIEIMQEALERLHQLWRTTGPGLA